MAGLPRIRKNAAIRKSIILFDYDSKKQSQHASTDTFVLANLTDRGKCTVIGRRGVSPVGHRRSLPAEECPDVVESLPREAACALYALPGHDRGICHIADSGELVFYGAHPGTVAEVP